MSIPRECALSDEQRYFLVFIIIAYMLYGSQQESEMDILNLFYSANTPQQAKITNNNNGTVIIYFIICGVVWSTQTKSSRSSVPRLRGEAHSWFPQSPTATIIVSPTYRSTSK